MTGPSGWAAFEARLRSLGAAMPSDERLARLVLSSATGYPLDPPGVLRLRLTLSCDARCSMCSIHSPLKTADLMSRSERGGTLPGATVARLLGEARSMGVPNLNLQGGEPFLHPEFADILAHSLAAGFIVKFFTNGGEAADAGIIERAVGASGGSGALYVMVSIDALHELHDEIRGVPGLFRSALDFVRRAAAAGERFPNLHVGISCAVMSSNCDRLVDFVNYFFGLGVHVTLMPLVSFGPEKREGGFFPVRYLPEPLQPDAGQLGRLAEALDALCWHPGVQDASLLKLLPELGDGRPTRQVCLADSIGVFVTADGRYQECPISSSTVGSVDDASLEEAWYGGLAEARRATFCGCRVPCTCYRPQGFPD